MVENGLFWNGLTHSSQFWSALSYFALGALALAAAAVKDRRQLGLAIVMGSAVLIGAIESEARTAGPPEVKRIIVTEAELGGVPASLALAIAHVESNFLPRAASPAGARGVMQIMPITAERLFGIDPDELWDARLNVQLGVIFLADLIRKYGGRWDLALSHYNAGSIEGSGAQGRPLPRARAYVGEVLKWERHYALPGRIAGLIEPENRDGWVAVNAPPTPGRATIATTSAPSPIFDGTIAKPAIARHSAEAIADAPLPDDLEARRLAIRDRLADFMRVATIRDVVP